ncbi:MAG: hypothetical protein Q4F77_12750 [Acinetobacter sp.]|uniref:hypothetical protein n=1 Tax=Acinetobacter sp. TaxID=472 RepID=UPI0026DEC23F|nr:hypothetical protein [Acinetobacter sp.]MDO5544150.1 hypothetical protein [Acinetobacter sp.]
MRQLWGNGIIVCCIVTSMSVMAAPQLFNIELKGATRDQIRSALQNTNVKVVREDSNYWIDKYNSNAVLEGTTDLNFGYTSNGKFAYAEYKFPVFMDSGKIIEVANFVSSKYGQPSQRSGNPNLGQASFTWNFKNGMSITAYRGWPDTTTYLNYKDKVNYSKMNAEIENEQKRQLKQKAQQQSSAF